MEFTFTAHKINVQTSSYSKHKRTLAITDELLPRAKWGDSLSEGRSVKTKPLLFRYPKKFSGYSEKVFGYTEKISGSLKKFFCDLKRFS